jgi:hypothetical protein
LVSALLDHLSLISALKLVEMLIKVQGPTLINYIQSNMIMLRATKTPALGQL